MNHASQDRQAAGEPSTVADAATHLATLELRDMPPESFRVPAPPLIDSPDAAARALRDYFLANADRDDNAANDELVAELVRRIRAQRGSSDGGRSQQAGGR